MFYDEMIYQFLGKYWENLPMKMIHIGILTQMLKLVLAFADFGLVFKY
jgi:hypothetical protein